MRTRGNAEAKKKARTGRTRLWRSRQGVAAVEFALAAPLLLLLVIGFVEFGRVIDHHHIIAKGLRDGARYFTRVPDPADATYIDNAKNLAMTGSLDGSEPFLLYYWDDKTNEIDIAVETVSDPDNTFRGEPNLAVTMEAEVPYEVGFFPGWFGLDFVTFTVRHQERYIGE